MAFYVKARPAVASFLGLTATRNTLPDGNCLLWQADMLRFGPLTALADSAARVGALILTPAQARAEQDGKVCNELPQPTDPRFAQGDESADTPTDDNPENTMQS